MKNFNLIFLITITVFIFSTCVVKSRTTEVMSSWKGSHISKVIASWGPETKLSGDGKGGKVYTWEKKWTTSGYYDFQDVYHEGKTKTCIKNFYVNEKGIIYYWRWQGACG